MDRVNAPSTPRYLRLPSSDTIRSATLATAFAIAVVMAGCPKPNTVPLKNSGDVQWGGVPIDDVLLEADPAEPCKPEVLLRWLATANVVLREKDWIQPGPWCHLWVESLDWDERGPQGFQNGWTMALEGGVVVRYASNEAQTRWSYSMDQDGDGNIDAQLGYAQRTVYDIDGKPTDSRYSTQDYFWRVVSPR